MILEGEEASAMNTATLLWSHEYENNNVIYIREWWVDTVIGLTKVGGKMFSVEVFRQFNFPAELSQLVMVLLSWDSCKCSLMTTKIRNFILSFSEDTSKGICRLMLIKFYFSSLDSRKQLSGVIERKSLTKFQAVINRVSLRIDLEVDIDYRIIYFENPGSFLDGSCQI